MKLMFVFGTVLVLNAVMMWGDWVPDWWIRGYFLPPRWFSVTLSMVCGLGCYSFAIIDIISRRKKS